MKSEESSNYITPRFGCAMAFIKDKIYIHGGQDLNQSFYADLFEIELIKNKENEFDSVKFIQNHVKYPISTNKIPCERNSHSIFNIENDIFIYSGGNSNGLIGDLWMYSHDGFKSIKGSYTGSEMSGIAFFKNKIYVFGGREIEKISDKIRIYNYDKDNYSTTTNQNLAMPFSISSYAYCVHKEFIIIYGGIEDDNFSNHLKIFNMDLHKWYFYNKQINIESSICPMMVNNDKYIIIFGGSSIQSETNQITILNINDILNSNNLVEIISTK